MTRASLLVEIGDLRARLMQAEELNKKLKQENAMLQ
jgi:hypothetical protein